MLGSFQRTEESGVEMESRKRVLTSPGSVSTKKASDAFTTPPTKKLKQARLPFQPLSLPTQISSPLDRPSKKRRISDIGSSVPEPQTQTIIKAKEVKDINTPNSAKKSASKKVEKRKVLKPLVLEPPVVETEVTSSSEEPPVRSPVLKKKPKPLEKFLLSVQQPTSTSDEEIIDLVDEDSQESKAVKDAGGDVANLDKDVQSSSADVVTVEDGSADAGIKDTASTTSDVQIAEIDSADDDEEEGDESSLLESSVGSQEAGDTSIESVDGGDSVTADDATTQPKNPADSSQVLSTPKTALKPPRKTPKSAKTIQKEQERERLRQEKAKLKAEKQQQAEQEKAEKKRLKEEARLAKEAEMKAAKAEKEAKLAEAKRLRELEKEQKLKERQEKLDREEKERLEKKAQKEEKQRQKTLELEAKAEEKRKKEEEQKKLEEEKTQKSSKQKQMFKSFFKKIDTPEVVNEPKEKSRGRFAPYQLQKGMVLAPVCGFEKLSKREDQQKFDELFISQDATNLYLKQLKGREILPGKRGKTTKKPAEPATGEENMETEEEDSIQMVEDVTPVTPSPAEVKKTTTKAKLLQFHENQRPAYYGTWTKISRTITPRNYLKKDEDFLDYEFDSDEEWEEPGESLSDSEGEDEAESDAGDESDDGFFVEHGYLSESEDPMDEEETVEHWKAKRKNRALAWEVELKRQTQVLKPIIVGCFWVNGSEDQSKADKIKLQSYKAVVLTTVPIDTTHTKEIAKKAEERTPSPTITSSGGQPKSGPVNKKPVPEEAMPHLLRLVHGNTIGVKGLIREFREFWRLQQGRNTPSAPVSAATASPSADHERSVSPLPGSPSISSTTPVRTPSVREGAGTPTTGEDPSSTNSTPDEPEIQHAISKRQLDLTITSIAVREKRLDCYARICWYVHKHVLEKYNLLDLPVPCQWQHRTGHLAVNRAASPQVATGQNPAVLPPQKISSAPASAARRIVPTKVGPSVMTLLQQQKPAVVKLKPCVSTEGAAGMLAQAAVMCSAQQQLPSTVQVAPSNLSTTLATHNPPVLLPANSGQSTATQAITEDPPKPAKKKIKTLSSFFTPSKSPNTIKPPNIVQSKNEPVSDSVNSDKKAEVKIGGSIPATTSETRSNSSPNMNKKPEIMVIKDLLSRAKVNRLNKQNSPERKKMPVVQTGADTTARDEPEIIILD